MRMNYPPEEIAEAHDRNENFDGKRANLEKIRLYHSIKSDLSAFAERCEDAGNVGWFDPNPREKHAILWLDLSPASILNKEEVEALAAIVCKSDGLVISAMEDHVRITFDVKNIWED